MTIYDDIKTLEESLAIAKKLVGEFGTVTTPAGTTPTILQAIEDLSVNREYYATKALMDADLAHVENVQAEVMADPVADNNRRYIKVGASGTGSWSAGSVDRLTTTLATGNGTNLCYDPFNRIAAVDGIDILPGGRLRKLGIATTSILTVETDEPLNPRLTPSLKQTGIDPTIAERFGRTLYLDEMGLKAGDTITAAIHGYLVGRAHIMLFFRNATNSILGDATTGGVYGPGEVFAMDTKIIPEDTVTVELGFMQVVDGGADSHIFAMGVWLGSSVRGLTDTGQDSTLYLAERAARTGETDALTADVSRLDNNHKFLKQQALDSGGTLRVASSQMPADVYNIRSVPVFLSSLEVGIFIERDTVTTGYGRRFTVLDTLIVNEFSCVIDTAPLASFIEAEPSLKLFLYCVMTDTYLYNQEFPWSLWGDSTTSGTLTLPWPEITLLQDNEYRLGLCTEVAGMGFSVGGNTSTQKGGITTNFSDDTEDWYTWDGGTYSFAFKLNLAKPCAAQFDLLSTKTEVTLSEAAAVTLDANIIGSNIGYDNSGYMAWGTMYTLDSDITFNVVEFAPPLDLVAENGYGIIVILNEQFMAIGIALISKAVWNAAKEIGGTCHAHLQTPITRVAGDVFYVAQLSNENRMSYVTTVPIPQATARIFISNGGWKSGVASTVPYYRLLNDPGALEHSSIPLSATDKAIVLQELLAETSAQYTHRIIPDIILPRTIPLLVGDTVDTEQISLYFNNMITGHFDLRSVDVTCVNGYQYHAWWRMEPGDTDRRYNDVANGDLVDFKVDVRNEEIKIMASATTTLTFVDKSKITPHRHLCIGDSMTRGGAFLERVLLLPNVSLQGIRHYDTDPDGINREGRGGWTVAQYMDLDRNTSYGNYSPFVFPVGKTGAQFRGNTEFWRSVITAPDYESEGFQKIARGWQDEPAPFEFDTTGYPIAPTVGDCVVDPSLDPTAKWLEWTGAVWEVMTPQPESEVSFAKYLDRFSAAFTDGNPQSVSFLLGTNTFSRLNNGITEGVAALWVGDMTTIITSIRESLPEAKIIISMPITGSNQDAAAWFSGCEDPADLIRSNMQEAGRLILDTWDNDTALANNIYIAPMILGLDPVRGFGTQTIAANKYSSETITIPIDMIHPAKEGYYQMGDVLAAVVQMVREE